MNPTDFENYTKTITTYNLFDNNKTEFYTLFQIKNKQLFYLRDYILTEIIFTDEYPGYTSINPNINDIIYDKPQFNTIKDLINNTKQKENKNYFIIRSTDQTYDGISFKDIRCH